MADIETKVISQSKTKPIEWERFIDDIFSLWNSDKKEINLFIKQANNFHPTIKFTAEISENETSYYYHSSTRVLPVVPENNVASQRFPIAFEFLAAVALADIC